MSTIDISSLPISKIKSALKDLGLSGSGTKKELIERYNEYMKNPEKSAGGGDGEKGVEVVEDHEGVSAVAVKEENGTVKEDAEKSVMVPEGVSGDGAASEAKGVEVAVEAAAVETTATSAEPVTTETTPATEPTAATEEAAATAVTEATAATETTPATTETTPATTTTDIEAELTRREERAKRFGGEFDRERCREQLLKEQQRTADASLRESRRARFGATDAEKKQQREARFGTASGDASKTNAEPVNDAVKAARIAKFGQVDMSRFERKRSQPLSRGRKSRRFH